jgi:four helix bundle protein
MTTNQKEDFEKRIYHYATEVVRFVEELRKDSTTHILGNQLLRSGISVTANIFEAKSASSKKDYINFYHYALKSANESKLWVSLLRDANKVAENKANVLLQETTEIANIIAASILTMKGKRWI